MTTNPDHTSTSRPPRKSTSTKSSTSSSPAATPPAPAPLSFSPPSSSPLSDPPAAATPTLPPAGIETDGPEGFDGGFDQMPPAPTKPGSGSSPEFSGADRRALKKVLREGLDTFGKALNRILTVDEVEQEAGLYLLDDDDTEGIADPAANIISRRGGLGAAANPDVNDAIRGLITFAAYLIRTLGERRALRRARVGDPTADQPAEA